ncbi:MAG: Lrp/AsnC family transcriptional regulator, partial [Bacteroidota bacterium]
ISKKVGLSSPSVAERIQKMEDAGIIKGYRVQLNMERLGYTLGVFITIKIRFGQVKHFSDFVKKLPEICECHKLTGNDCMLMRGFVRDPKHLEALNEQLAVYGALTTSLVLSSVVEGKTYHSEF